LCTVLDWGGRVAENIRGYVERALGEDGPVDRMMLRELDLRAQVIDTLTSRAHTRVSPCLDITSCARGMLRLELTSARFHWAALQIRPIFYSIRLVYPASGKRFDLFLVI